MSVSSSTISTKELMRDSMGVATPIDHYQAHYFGPIVHRLENMHRGLTRSMRDLLFQISQRFGKDLVVTFQFTTTGWVVKGHHPDYYAEAVAALEGHEHGIQDHIIAWTMLVVEEYKGTAMYEQATTGKPHYPDFIDSLFVDYDYETDYRGVEMVVPRFRFVIPGDWEKAFNEAKKQQLARALGQMFWSFRHGIIAPFEDRQVRDRLQQAAEWLVEWKKPVPMAIDGVEQAGV